MIDRRAIVAGLVLSAAVAPAAAEPSASSVQIYAEQCAFCHGPKGAGDGAASSMLTPRPTAFVNADYWKSADRDELAKTVAKGKSGTAMVPFEAKLSGEQIEALVAYLETFSK